MWFFFLYFAMGALYSALTWEEGWREVKNVAASRGLPVEPVFWTSVCLNFFTWPINLFHVLLQKYK